MKEEEEEEEGGRLCLFWLKKLKGQSGIFGEQQTG